MSERVVTRRSPPSRQKATEQPRQFSRISLLRVLRQSDREPQLDHFNSTPTRRMADMPLQCLTDIKPQTPVASLNRATLAAVNTTFPLSKVAPLVGMSTTFIQKVCGRNKSLTTAGVLALLDQDAFAETFIPRSRILSSLLREECMPRSGLPPLKNDFVLLHQDAMSLIRSLPDDSVQCVVTSTPYWGLRVYKEPFFADWADGASCPFGHEQTPEEFVRHTVQILHALWRVLKPGGSIWWNVMDSFNTRTQIRGNAAEALRAMQGKDRRSWREHACRRYSAGHSYLKDGEQCMIPARIAERASRLGFYVKSVITWAKTSSLPEPQESRVSRNLEYVLHLSKTRTPTFNKEIYRDMPSALGGRNNGSESDKLSDVWTLPTSSGRDGHGAQFPLALPARCIALSTVPRDIVLDPFVGSGNTGVAALKLGRGFIGSDVSQDYLSVAAARLDATRLEAVEEQSRNGRKSPKAAHVHVINGSSANVLTVSAASA